MIATSEYNITSIICYLQHFLQIVEKKCPESLGSDGASETRANGDGGKDVTRRRSRGGTGVVLSNVTAKWARDQTNNTLDNIDLIVEPGRLVAIIGSVGAGKVIIHDYRYRFSLVER